ncbi:MAG: hypothetical protein AVDCRST_MAG62-1102 [uncultured Sphingomonas sp.]|uniref:Uncharacterized protein n=1 Tax=uncultured Sphingomonas sp. TaxID=158754 RepID=A0A6J4TDX3_9SPHN|nr:MAG: hypothetical protein AVDCRST_MAG62-1102 [uncultured Sphingomonas sp.]
MSVATRLQIGAFCLAALVVYLAYRRAYGARFSRMSLALNVAAATAAIVAAKWSLEGVRLS